MNKRSNASPFAAILSGTTGLTAAPIKGNRWNDPVVNPEIDAALGYADFGLLLSHAQRFAAQKNNSGLNKRLREQPNNVSVRNEARQEVGQYLASLSEPVRQKLGAELKKPGAYNLLETAVANRMICMSFLFGTYTTSISEEKAVEVASTCWINKVAKRTLGSVITLPNLNKATIRETLKDLPTSIIQEAEASEDFAQAVANLSAVAKISFSEAVNDKTVPQEMIDSAVQGSTNKLAQAMGYSVNGGGNSSGQHGANGSHALVGAGAGSSN